MSTLEQMYQSAVVRVSAHDRVYGTTSAFVVNLPPQYAEFRSVRGIQVQSVHLPNTFYNVMEGRNTIKWTSGTHERSYTWPPGYYTLEELLDSDESTYADNTTHTFHEQFGYSLTPLDKQLKYELWSKSSNDDRTIDTTSYMAELLGLAGSGSLFQPKKTLNDAGTGYNAVHVLAPSVPRVGGLPTAFICCNQLGANFVDTQNGGRHSAVIASVPNTAVIGAANHYVPTHSAPIWYRGNFRHLASLSISIQDEYGEIIDNNGADWTMLLTVYYKNRI